MSTKLARKNLRPLYKKVLADETAEAHPNLLLQRGLLEYSNDSSNSKSKEALIDRICSCKVTDFYKHAYSRWNEATANASRYRGVTLRLETRMFIGLAGSGMLETGCAISHSHGAPYIPGSSIKGVVSCYARDRLSIEGNGKEICDELFGGPAFAGYSADQSGQINFHDAWWVPNSDDHPFVREVVTTHHPDYYGQDGTKPATDFDSPVPNAQVAVSGDFFFVLEGPANWLDLAERMLIAALGTRGVGNRTRTGYGLFRETADNTVGEQNCEWLDKAIAEVGIKYKIRTETETLRSKVLADEWSNIKDPQVKKAAYFEIRACWQERDWWKSTEELQGAMKKAKKIYDFYAIRKDFDD